MTLAYLDANIFVYSSVDQGGKGTKCRSIIRDVEQGSLQAATSSLTFDEIVWVVKKLKGRQAAFEAGKVFLNISGLKLVEVNIDTLNSALNLMNEYDLESRDSIHAATALLVGADYFVSDDGDFDKLQHRLKRKAI